MKKTAKLLSLAGVSLLSVAALAACGAKGGASKGASEAQTTFPKEITHEGTPIKGGQLNYAIVAASTSTGLLMDELTSTTVDSSFGSLVDETLFGYDGDRKLDDSGIATPEFDLEKNTVKITLNSKDYKWSDGQPFTIDDYIFTTTAMSHKDYTGVRFDDDFLNIIGAEEYHNGQADSISGLEKIDDYTVLVHFKSITPSMMYAGGAIPHYLTPKHIFKDIPVKDWEKSEYGRTSKFVGMGPFTIKDIVQGESITYVPNEHYFKGKPKIDSLKMDIVSPDTIVSEMQAGNYDIAEMPSDQLDSYKNLSNISLVGKIAPSYEYIAFNLGKRVDGKNVTDEKAKTNDVKLRQALAYALDTEQAGKALYNGLYHPGKSLIISFFGDLQNQDIEPYSYNPEKAKELLDEAGYKDVDGDGIREGKDGKPFKLSFAARQRTQANETLMQQYLTWWKEVGLNVELYTGRTIELNAFYDMIQANDPNIDFYTAGWGTGYDPNPSGSWGPVADFNMTRFVSDENTKLLEALGSKDAFDEKKNKEHYDAWQKYAHEQAFAFPTFEMETVTAINKRLKYYDLYLGSASKATWDTIELLAEKGEVAK